MPASSPRPTLPPLTWWGTMRWAAVAPHLPKDPDTVAVEFGCGLGAYGARFAARYPRYVGVEPDPTSAAVAQARVAPFSGEIVASASGLEPASAQFVCAFEVLEHLQDDRGVLIEWLRTAADGALVIVSVPAEPDRFGPWDEKVGHYRRYSRESMTELLSGAGLQPLLVQHYGYPFGYALETARNFIARREAARARNATMEVRTETSGRQHQARNAWMGAARWHLTLPFRRWQERHPQRGPGLIAVARVAR